MKVTPRTILVESLRDFRRAWAQLILTDLLGRVLAIVVLTPLVGLLLKVFLATTATGVVTDGAIVDFLLHPTGLAALLVVGAVSLGILFAETGQLMVIGFACIEDRRATWFDALKYAFGRVGALIDLAWFAVVRLLLISLPFLVAVGALYWFLLRAYDINYYLTQKPPEFLAAVVIAGLVLTVMALLIIIRISGWLLALPMVLFEGMGGRQAMRASQEATVAHRRKIALWLVEWIVAVVLLSALVSFVAVRLGDVLISSASSNLTLLLVGLSAVIVGSGLANLAVTVFTTVLFSLFMVRLYRFVVGPGELRPEIAARGALGEKTSWRIPGKTILCASAVALVVITVGPYLAMRDLDWGDHVQIIAHRGGAGVAPENTMAAFKRGIADGADWLELDVQENADGVVVIEHDRDFMRVAGANLEVWKATNADLAHLDVGSFFDPTFSDQRVPTLREVLELAKGQAGVFIELKYHGHDRSLEAKVVDLVEKTGMASDIVIMSLEYDGVRKTAALRPSWTYGLLSAVAIGDLTRLDVDFLALTANAASYATIRRAHRRGMKVYAWTVDDPVQMSVMMSRGVDGIITDQVALAYQVKDLRAKLTPLGRFVVWMAGETGLLRGMEKSSARGDA
jgi:glycerophosphoryl diester phosphodiesterase